MKRWKLSPVDIAERHKYRQMSALRDRMLERTHAATAPWFVADFNDQKSGRLNLIRHLLDQVPRTDLPEPAKKLPKLKGKPGKQHLPATALHVPSVF